MEKTIFEQMGGTYTQQGDCYLPNLVPVPTEKETRPIGSMGATAFTVSETNRHRITYANLLTSGKLNSYLVDIDERAENMFLRLVKQMAEHEGVTERLKAENQMEWVGQINNIRICATEIVNQTIIFR